MWVRWLRGNRLRFLNDVRPHEQGSSYGGAGSSRNV